MWTTTGPLKEHRFWQLFSRSLFFVDLPDATGRRQVYEVDVRHGRDSSSSKRPTALYRDGIQVQQANPPMAFPVPGGVIEVATSEFGLKRVHFVGDGERMLRPHPCSTEGLRARFERRFPRTSGVVDAVGLVVLLVGLTVTLATVAEQLTRVEVIAVQIGTFTSPIRLPTWAKVALGAAGALAAIDRALGLKSTLSGGG